MKRALLACAAIVLPVLAVVILSNKSGMKVPSIRIPSSRIVSLSPSLSRMLNDIGAGDSIIGVTSYDLTFGGREIVGTVINPNIEKIIMLKPDLVIASDEDGAVQCTEPLAGAGIPVKIFPRAVLLDQIIGCYIELGDIAGAGERARAKAGEYRRRAGSSVNTGVSVVFLISNDPLIAASADSFIGKIISDAGGVCAVQGNGNPYPIISKEHLVGLNPDIVISVTDGGDDEMIRQFSKFGSLEFVRKRAAFYIPSETACYFTPADYFTTRDELVRIIAGVRAR